MRRNASAIGLILVFALLLVGSFFLYQSISTKVAPAPVNAPVNAPAVSPTTAPAHPDPPTAEPAQAAPPVETAPNFRFTDRDGNEAALSDFFGQPIVINFWASWCGPCRSELPEFENAYLTYGDSVQFLIVDLADGYSETRDDATAYIDGNGFTFPLFFDEYAEGSVAYGINAIPFSVFIDADGQVVDRYLGAMTEDVLVEHIEALLN